MRAEGVDPLVVDGGNLFFYKSNLKAFEKDQLLRKAQVLVEGYNHIGVDAMAIGPLDFAAGFETLRQLEQLAEFPILCANIVDRKSGEPVFQPCAVVEHAGIKVGLIGVVDSVMGARGLGPGGEDFRVEPLHNTVNHYASELAQSGCEVVVVISSVPPKKFRLLAQDIEAVNLYVAGDPRDKLRIPYVVGSAMIANTTQLGKYLGHVILPLKGGHCSDGMKHQLVAMKPDAEEDPVVKRLVDGYYRYAGMIQRRDPENYVRELEVEVNVEHATAMFISAEECGRCHGAIYARWREGVHAQALARLPADAQNRVECLECHVTGLGLAGGFPPAGADNHMGGVQCEACHGAGSLHPAGEITRSGKEVAGICRQCHTRSRSPDFKLKEYLDRLCCVQTALDSMPSHEGGKLAQIH